MFKKDTFKLVVVASVALFLPYILFAQCAVVGYAFGQDYVGIEYTTTTFPSSLQLDRLAHVIASDIGCKDDGRLFTGRVPDFWEGAPPSDNVWNGNKNEWLENLVNRTHAKGVDANCNINLI
jgi:hypothetical protein